MSIKINPHNLSSVEKTLEQNTKHSARHNSNNLSTISSFNGSTKSERGYLSIIFAPLIYFWNLIFNRSSLPNIDQETILQDISALDQLKIAIQNKNLLSFKTSYDDLSNDTKVLLQNIYYQWVTKNTMEAPYANMDKYIRENPFNFGLESSCIKAIENFVKLSKFKSFVEVLRISTLTSDENSLVGQFNLLPYELRDGIKYTIWKALNPHNSTDYDFGGTILKKYATDPFIKDIVIATVKGLKKTDDHQQWYLEMPKGWASRKKFTI